MQPEPKKAAAPLNAEGITTCPNCHVQMPSILRFCRSCGFRLGEGVAEYVETVRLPHQPTASPNGSAAGAQQFGANVWAPLAPAATAQQPAGQASAYVDSVQKKHGRRKRTPWIVWVVLGITVASVTGGGLMAPFGLRNKTRTAALRTLPRSYVGLSETRAANGGVTFDYVTPPGSAADKAGLIGGDIITTLDAKQVTSQEDLLKVLVATPVGKTIDVVYIRDGETKTTQLTTISREEQNRLEELFDNRPEGKGFLGITDWERTLVPGTNIYGVRLDTVAKNRPGYIAGLRDGDIILEFNGTPIRTAKELVARIERVVPDSVVKVIVMRGSERLEIPVKIGVDD